MLCWSLWDKMKKRVFKYKFIKVISLIFGFIMLLFCGVGFIELSSKFTQRNGYLILIILALLILVNAVSIILIFVKSKKSIIALNIFYSFVILLFLTAFILREFNDSESFSVGDRIIFITILSSSIILTFLINKFRYKDLYYKEIEFIGEQE